MIEKVLEKELDLEIERLVAEMDRFDEDFRNEVCNALPNHKEVHSNVIVYPSGAVFCDQLRNAKSRRFKKQMHTFLFRISETQEKKVMDLQI